MQATLRKHCGCRAPPPEVAAAHACREEEVKVVVETALKEAESWPKGLSFDGLSRALEGAELNMEVEVPADY